MAGRRKKTGDRRIDAAIDHFVAMGFQKVDIRNVINSLLRNVYGNDGWPFLEENCYHVVQEALLEKQEQEQKFQLQLLQKKKQQQQEEEEEDEEEAQKHVQEQQEEGWEENDDIQEREQDEWEDDEAQQQEAAMMGAASENNMPIVKVHNEEVAPMIIDPPPPKAALPHPAATAALPHPAATGSGRTRRPCFGWISEPESDSDYEEFLASRQQLVQVPSPGGDLGKRKRRSRWDVK